MESKPSHCNIVVTIIEILVTVVNCLQDLSTKYCTFLRPLTAVDLLNVTDVYTRNLSLCVQIFNFWLELGFMTLMHAEL
jgi:hypothetical protein